MFWIAFITAAVLLAFERVTYAFIWYAPGLFRQLCLSWPLNRFATPVDAMQALFYLFKAIQLGVFLGWCVFFSNRFPPLPTAPPAALTIGILLLIVGQVLNASVFWRLGKRGVFYGNKLGHDVPWVDGWPFSLVPHPQYFGTAVSIWGFFLVMRFPSPDWIALPLLQTVYYIIGARIER